MPNVAFTGPTLPTKRRDGTAWPAFTRDMWAAWSSMPHCALWRPSDWQFALDTLELASRAFGDGARASLWAELRTREKVMGTTWSARQDMCIRYVEPAAVQAKSAGVTVLEDYRNL